MRKMREKLIDYHETIGRRKFFVIGPYLNWSGSYSTHAINDFPVYLHHNYKIKSPFDDIFAICNEPGSSFLNLSTFQWNKITECKLLMIIWAFKCLFILRFN